MAVVLLNLGSWQLDRLAWKTALIAEREAALARPPALLPGAGSDFSAFEFRPVLLRGRFLHQREIYLINRTLNGKAGLHVVTPFQRDSADGGGVVLIDRGWVPLQKRDPATRQEGQIAGDVEISGIVRLGETGRGTYTPANHPEKGVWFTPDPSAMGRVMDLEVLPLIVEISAGNTPGGLPVGGQTALKTVNNHLSYALTWFALAVVLGGIYILFVRRLLRERRFEG